MKAYINQSLGSCRRLQTELGVCDVSNYFGSANFGTSPTRSAGPSLAWLFALPCEDDIKYSSTATLSGVYPIIRREHIQTLWCVSNYSA